MEIPETMDSLVPALTEAQELEAKQCAAQIERWSSYATKLRRTHDHLVEMAPGVIRIEHEAERLAERLDEVAAAVERLNKGDSRTEVGEPPVIIHPTTVWVKDERAGTSYGSYFLVLLGDLPTILVSLFPTHPQYMGGYEIRYGRQVVFTKILYGAGDAETGRGQAVQWVQERLDAILMERESNA